MTGCDSFLSDKKLCISQLSCQKNNQLQVVQFSSVLSLSHVRLCDPMDCSMSYLPVRHHLLELAQTPVHSRYFKKKGI